LVLLLIPFTLALCAIFAVNNVFATIVLPYMPMFSLSHLSPSFSMPFIALSNVCSSVTELPVTSPRYVT